MSSECSWPNELWSTNFRLALTYRYLVKLYVAANKYLLPVLTQEIKQNWPSYYHSLRVPTVDQLGPITDIARFVYATHEDAATDLRPYVLNRLLRVYGRLTGNDQPGEPAVLAVFRQLVSHFYFHRDASSLPKYQISCRT